jgi:hypothetical protein
MMPSLLAQRDQLITLLARRIPLSLTVWWMPTW